MRASCFRQLLPRWFPYCRDQGTRADRTRSNSALYVSSRTLFFLARDSSFKRIRNTIGRTNYGRTPIAAILVSFMPGGFAFLVVRASTTAFIEVLISSLIVFLPHTDCSIAHRHVRSPIHRSSALHLCKRMYCFHPLSTRVSRHFLANDV